MTEQVDLDSTHCEKLEVSLIQQKWVTKFTSGDFAHGMNMQWWNFQMVGQCPALQ